jgi:probable HAF family extracellular repeat protein
LTDDGFAFGINNLSQVVGWSSTGGPAQATVWEPDGQVTDLGSLTGYQVSQGLAINDYGQVAIYAFDSVTAPHHALFYDGSEVTDMGTLGGDAEPRGINNAGQVVGYSGNHAFIWDSIQGIRDLGTLPGDTTSLAFAINNRGQVVGSSTHLEGHLSVVHAAVWQDGVVRDLNDFLPSNSGWVLHTAYGINNRGWIVGSRTVDGVDHAFLFKLKHHHLPPPGIESAPRYVAVAQNGVSLAIARQPCPLKAADRGNSDPVVAPRGVPVAHEALRAAGSSLTLSAAAVPASFRARAISSGYLEVDDAQQAADPTPGPVAQLL